LIELSGVGSVARTTTAISILRQAQREGETTAWIQPEAGPLFPPDLHEAGIDLDALVVVHVPVVAGPVAPCKAAELLLRCGAFGLVVLDPGSPLGSGTSWQGRLLGLARQHHSRIVIITDSTTRNDSLGPLVSLRVEPRRIRHLHGRFAIEHHVLKNKSGAPIAAAIEHHRGPWGLG
jgi:recombination protein RecA